MSSFRKSGFFKKAGCLDLSLTTLPFDNNEVFYVSYVVLFSLLLIFLELDAHANALLFAAVRIQQTTIY
jgi:hypothetical protein